jgi:hypothetical protein
VSVRIVGPQRLTVCPPEFQERLTQAGGTNRYNQPLYKLVWGQAHTIRAGGYWAEEGFTGYQDVHLIDTPSWLLLEYHPPEEYGSPTSWYIDNYDEATGLLTQGEFPHQGRYEILWNLSHKELIGGVLKVQAFPLCRLLLDTILPLVLAAKNVSHERKAAAVRAHKEREEAIRLQQITDARMDARLAFGGNHFVGKYGSQTNLIEQKMKIMERGMQVALAQLSRWGKGMSIGR